MPRSHRDEPSAQLVRRILLRHIERALEYSRRGRLASDEAIHAARKELKRARAALRLLRPGLGRSAYRRENAALRRAAHPLGAIRDTKALLDRCDELSRRTGRVAPPGLRRVLESEHARARRELRLRADALATECALLDQLKQRSDRWPIEQAGTPVDAGVKHTYSRGRRALELSEAERSAVRLHELRKQAQYLWHQLQLLEPLARKPIGKLARAAHRVSELLGEDHDLALLEAKAQARIRSPGADSGAASRAGKRVPPVGGTAARPGAARQYEAFLRVLGARRRRLEEKAFDVGHRLYRERPRAFVGRIVGR